LTYKTIIFSLALLNVCFQAKAQDTITLEDTRISTRVLVEELTIPWDLVWGPDGWIWFNERDGDIYRLHPDNGEMQHIHRISETYQSWDNSGFHAFALHPNFPYSPYIFAHFTDSEYGSRVVKYTYSFVDQSLYAPVVMFEKIPGNSSHNGSRFLFKANGDILFCMGDAFSSNEAQNMESWSGKILCFDEAGNPCADNPIPGSYIYSSGHRNPQGLCYGRDSLIYSSEHGTDIDDELNIIYKGRNYGWPLVEGFCDYTSEMDACDSLDVVEPLFTWTPTAAPGGLEYFDHESIPEWQHSLTQTFLKDKRLSVLPLSDDGLSIKDSTEWKLFVKEFGRLRDVLISPTGRVFICTSNQETNGQWVTPDNYDKIIEVYNVDYDYATFVPEAVKPATQLFPVPATDHLWMRLDSDQPEVNVQLIDMEGNVVLEETLVGQIFENMWQLILPDNLKTGVYSIRAESAGTQINQKIVILKG